MFLGKLKFLPWPQSIIMEVVNGSKMKLSVSFTTVGRFRCPAKNFIFSEVPAVQLLVFTLSKVKATNVVIILAKIF